MDNIILNVNICQGNINNMDKNSRFLDIRKELRFNQQDFAKELDTSQNQISRFEKDKDIPFKILETLIFKYNVNINWLIKGDGEMFIKENNNMSVQNKSGNIAINGNIVTINTNDYPDSEEIKELLELLKQVPKSWLEKILIKLKNHIKAFEEEF